MRFTRRVSCSAKPLCLSMRYQAHGLCFELTECGAWGILTEVDTKIREVDIRLPGKGNSNSHGARPVY